MNFDRTVVNVVPLPVLVQGSFHFVTNAAVCSVLSISNATFMRKGMME